MDFIKALWSALETLLAPSMTPSITPETVPANPPPHVIPLLDLFCEAIAQYEGANTPGTIPYKTDNPGDLRWPYGKPFPYGAVGIAYGNFLVFTSRAQGMAALHSYVTHVGKGMSKLYPANCNIQQFFSIYAPSGDHNDPNKYAKWVANYCKVGTDYRIKDMLA